MPFTVTGYIADRTILTAEWLAHYVRTTAADKLNWTPEVPGAAPLRTVMQIVDECVVVNRYFAGLLKSDPAAVAPRDHPGNTYANAEEACAALIESAKQMAQAIRELGDAGLSNTVAHWRGPMHAERAIVMAVRNMEYHGGQVNFIQLLAGDPEFHVPATFL